MQVFFFSLGAGNDQKGRVWSRVGSGEVWRVDMKEGGGEAGGEAGGEGGNEGATGRGRLGGGNVEGEEGNEESEMGRGATGRGRC